jgi:hypothetical protein
MYKFKLTLLLAITLASTITAFSQTAEGHYRHLKGTVGTLPVTMDFVEKNADYYTGNWALGGTYYYDKNQQPIACYGTLDSVGKVLIYEFNLQEKEIYFYGDFDANGAFSGTWNDKSSGKSLPVTLALADKHATARFDFFQMADSAKLWPQLATSPKADFSLQMLLPAKDTDKQLAAFLTDYIFSGTALDSLPRSYAGTTPKVFYQQQRDAFFNEYRTWYIEDTPESIAEMPYVYNNEMSSSMSILYNEGTLLSVGYGSYSYMGGAHGNHATIVATYDTKARRAFTLNDIFLPGYEKILDKAIENAIRKQFGLAKGAPLSEVLFNDTVEHNNNFYLTGKGIVFLYNPYEAAAYAMGEIEAFVPFKEIKTVVKPAFLK